MIAVKVKPLVWEERKAGVFTAWGAHSVVRCWTEQGQGFHVNGEFYPTLEDAKAAAQVDYDARILSALEGE